MLACGNTFTLLPAAGRPAGVLQLSQHLTDPEQRTEALAGAAPLLWGFVSCVSFARCALFVKCSGCVREPPLCYCSSMRAWGHCSGLAGVNGLGFPYHLNVLSFSSACPVCHSARQHMHGTHML